MKANKKVAHFCMSLLPRCCVENIDKAESVEEHIDTDGTDLFQTTFMFLLSGRKDWHPSTYYQDEIAALSQETGLVASSSVLKEETKEGA